MTRTVSLSGYSGTLWMMWLHQILLPPGTFWIWLREVHFKSIASLCFSKAFIHYQFGIWKIARLIREQGPQLIDIHLDVEAVEDVRIHVEEGEGSNILMPKVFLPWSWFYYNPLLRDSRFLEFWAVPSLRTWNNKYTNIHMYMCVYSNSFKTSEPKDKREKGRHRESREDTGKP